LIRGSTAVAAVGAGTLSSSHPAPARAQWSSISGKAWAVIYTEPDLEGAEIEIRPASEQWRGVHTAVRKRRFADVVQFAAVFGSLAEGNWDLRVRGSTAEQPALAVRVTGGSVVEALWPEAS
jgi:hypothetical protein